MIPSANNPGPDGQSYFSGGIVLTNYGSRDKCNGQFDAIQVNNNEEEEKECECRAYRAGMRLIRLGRIVVDVYPEVWGAQKSGGRRYAVRHC